MCHMHVQASVSTCKCAHTRTYIKQQAVILFPLSILKKSRIKAIWFYWQKVFYDEAGGPGISHCPLRAGLLPACVSVTNRHIVHLNLQTNELHYSWFFFPFISLFQWAALSVFLPVALIFEIPNSIYVCKQ